VCFKVSLIGRPEGEQNGSGAANETPLSRSIVSELPYKYTATIAIAIITIIVLHKITAACQTFGTKSHVVQQNERNIRYQDR